MGRDLVAETASLQERTEAVAKRGVIHAGDVDERESLFATGAQGAFLVLFVIYQFLNHFAFNAFHAQFVFERASAARTKLLACLYPERGEVAIIDEVEAIQSGQRRFDNFGGSLFAAQVTPDLFAAARSK